MSLKNPWMAEVDELKEEQWKEFDGEHKEKSQENKSDKSIAVDA